MKWKRMEFKFNEGALSLLCNLANILRVDRAKVVVAGLLVVDSILQERGEQGLIEVIQKGGKIDIE